MAVKLNDIAKAAGVSLATVSMVLNGNPAISEATRKKVEKIAQELGYYPNQYAQKLAGGGRKTVGVIVPDIADLLCANLIRQLTAVLQKKSMELSLALSDNSAAGEEKAVTELLHRGVDGVIIIPSEQLCRRAGDRFRPLAARSIPFVFALSCYEDTEAPSVQPDVQTAYFEAMRYAHRLGYISPVFVAGKEESSASLSRRTGFRNGLDTFFEGSPIHLPERIYTAKGNGYEDGYAAALRLYNRRVETDIIFTENDLMGIGIINALRSIGIEIPEDVAVVSYGDTMFASVAPIPLTSINPNLAAVVEKAVSVLFEKDQPTAPVLLEATLMERKSTVNFFCNVR